MTLGNAMLSYDPDRRSWLIELPDNAATRTAQLAGVEQMFGSRQAATTYARTQIAAGRVDLIEDMDWDHLSSCRGASDGYMCECPASEPFA